MRRFLLLLALSLASLVQAAEHGGPRAADEQREGYQAGFGDVPQFGGPDGVSAQLRTADEARESTFQWKGAAEFFRPWYDWKGQLQDDHGVALGFFFGFLGQTANDTTTVDDSALGNISRFQGSWTLINRGKKDPGRIEWRVEYRDRMLGQQAPMDLSGAIGAQAANTGFPYTRGFDLDIAVLNWTQGFRDERIGYAVGRLAFDVYLDAMPFQTVSRGFVNRAFILNPTIATTGIGALGAVGRMFLGDNFIVGVQIYDGNAVNGDFDIDTFHEHEYLKAVDLAWTPSYARRKTDKIQFTYWDKDSRDKAGVPSGKGWAVSASWKWNEALLPFVRFGHSDEGAGVAAKTALSGGFEYITRPDQAITFGVGWVEPANKPSGTGDEKVIETSYKFQLAKNFSLLPDFQMIIDPANNPSESSVWALGLRAILTL